MQQILKTSMEADVIKNLGWFQKNPSNYVQNPKVLARYLEYIPQNIFEGIHAELHEENTRDGEY